RQRSLPPTTEHKPATTQYPSTPGFISNHWYGRWGQVSHSLHSLGHAVHGGIIPTANDLKKHFDTWRPALEAMLEQLEKNSH
ncbi:hypothetical protein JWH16_07300, partial [Xanthomonas campestris pv. campestris]